MNKRYALSIAISHGADRLLIRPLSIENAENLIRLSFTQFPHQPVKKTWGILMHGHKQ